jgi:carbamoyl-phosphate synthase large subunit
MNKKIIISAANGPIMKSLIMQLKKNGFYIIGIDSNSFGLADSFCDEFYKSPKGASKNFPKFLNRISNKVEAIFLFVDEELENISKNIENFSNLKKKVIISPKETINICNNKNIFYNFFKKKNVKLPSLASKSFSIIKPAVGRGGKNIFTTNDKVIISLFKKNSKYLVQKYIQGVEYTVDCVFDKNGHLIFAIPRKRILAQNVSVIGKVVRHNKLVKEIQKISSYLKFYGPANFQFIENKNGIWLIEINPRLSGSVIFSIKSGFNPFLISLKIHQNKNITLPKKIKYNEVHFRFWESISR